MNLLDRKWITNRVVLSTIHLGIIPENLLSLRLISPKTLQFCSDEGMSPYKELFCKLNTLRATREPMELGISPDKLLLPRFI